MEWKLGQRFQLRLQVSTLSRILSVKKHSSWKFRDRDDSLVMVDVNGGGGRVMVPGNIMRDNDNYNNEDEDKDKERTPRL